MCYVDGTRSAENGEVIKLASSYCIIINTLSHSLQCTICMYNYNVNGHMWSLSIPTLSSLPFPVQLSNKASTLEAELNGQLVSDIHLYLWHIITRDQTWIIPIKMIYTWNLSGGAPRSTALPFNQGLPPNCRHEATQSSRNQLPSWPLGGISRRLWVPDGWQAFLKRSSN